jgi:hypothetical protein
MHTNGKHLDHDALAWDLAIKAPFTRSGNDPSAVRVSLLPFIDVGTFLVAAYLRPCLRPKALR